MGRYGMFDVVRTERRDCKKASDTKADGDGMREYSFLRCPHCKTEDIAIPTSALRNNKSLTISNHIITCPSFYGDRPVNRNKRSKLVDHRTHEEPDDTGVDDAGHESDEMAPKVPQLALAAPVDPTPLHVVTTLISLDCETTPLHSKLNEDMTEIRKRLTNTEVNLESTKAKLEQTEAKLESTEARLDTTLTIVGRHQMWWGQAADALGYAQPSAPDTLVEKIRELRWKGCRPDDGLIDFKDNMMILIDNNSKMLDQKDKMLDQNRLMIAQKDIVIQEAKALQDQKNAIIEEYRRRLDAKEIELNEAAKMFQAKDVEMKEAQRTAQEALKAQATAASRYERVRREKESLRSKFDAEIKAKHEREKASRKHGASLLQSSLEHAHKQQMLPSAPRPIFGISRR